MTIRLYEVGGAVRDDILGIPTNDVDFVAEAPSFEELELWMRLGGFKVYKSNPEHFTLRARAPEHHSLYKRTNVVDVVMARRDGPYSDGRRPDYVEPGTLYDDLARRDFTVNAMARNESGQLIDPYNGLIDLHEGILRFVGNPMEKIREDGLRVMRALRFCVTHNLSIEDNSADALWSLEGAKMLAGVAIERIREELLKMFRADTVKSLDLIHNGIPRNHMRAIFRDGLWLEPTLKDR